MKKAGIVKPAVANWVPSIVFLHKRIRTLYFCASYRRPATFTMRDSLSVLRTDKRTDILGNKTLFSTLDAKSGYPELEVDKNSVDKASFVDHNGEWKYFRKLFGLKTASVTF